MPLGKIEVAFEEANLIADAEVVALAERVGLPGLVMDRVWIIDAANSGEVNGGAKVMTVLAEWSPVRTASLMPTGGG
jgi:hypothetical protein